jgi:hypothetical protein
MKQAKLPKGKLEGINSSEAERLEEVESSPSGDH